MALPFAVAYETVTVCRLAFESVTGKDIEVVPALPSLAVTSATESVGFGAGWTTNGNDLAVFCVPDLTVSVTFSADAVAGTVKEQRATPPRSDCVCAIALPPAAGVQTNSPCVRARPLSLRVILAETLKCAPCTACAGVAVAFPITGLTAALRAARDRCEHGERRERQKSRSRSCER